MRTNTPPSRALLALLCLLTPLAGRAAPAIVRDNTLGTGPTGALLPAGSITFNGNNYGKIAIPEAYGQRIGGNVFHSFKTFDIGSGEAAVFGINSATSNIISRVTGGQASQIAGLLTVDAGATASRPNVYLINPAGVTFSAGAAIDVPAAFNVSTANVLTFSNGSFESDPARASTLSSADPSAFGFLGAQSGNVRFQPGSLVQGAGGAAITVAAANIVLNDASLVNVNGDVRLAAVGTKAAAVPVNSTPSNNVDGTVAMAGNASIATLTQDASAAGDIKITTGELYVGDGVTPGNMSIRSFAIGPGAGAPGAIQIEASGEVYLGGGGFIGTTNNGADAGGAISINAATVLVDGQQKGAAIQTTTRNGDSRGGDITVRASGGVEVYDAGYIASYTFGAGAGGAVEVAAQDVTIAGTFANIGSQNSEGSSGNAGPVKITVQGQLTVSEDASITSTSLGAGSAGVITLRARDILLDGRGSSAYISSSVLPSSEGDAGMIDIAASGKLSILDAGFINSSTVGAGDAGSITIRAGSMMVENTAATSYEAGVESSALAGSSGNAGSIDIAVTGHLDLLDGAFIGSDVRAFGNGGSLKIKANTMTLAGSAELPAMISSSAGSTATGKAGTMSLETTGLLSLWGNAYILGLTEGAVNGGEIRVKAGSIDIGGHGQKAGIFSNALPGSTGNAGTIDIAATGKISIADRGLILSDTSGAGAAGSINVRAGSLRLEAADFYADISSSAAKGSSGNAGNLTIYTDAGLELFSGAALNVQTQSVGNAGTVNVDAGSILIDGKNGLIATGINGTARSGSSGNGGTLNVRSRGGLTIRAGGEISTATQGSGNAGSIAVSAAKLDIEAGDVKITGIRSDTWEGSSGSGGTIDVRASGTVALRDGGFITTETLGAGAGGSILVDAGDLLLSNGSQISASAESASSGTTGNVLINVRGQLTLRDDSFIGALNAATVATPNAIVPGSVQISARGILLDGSAFVSNSDGNVAAGAISVTFADTLALQSTSGISTKSFDGDGGALTVQGGNLISMNRGVIATSVRGGSGNGGDISVTADALVMQTGFIQANTAAADSSGGDVNIQVGSLLTSGSNLFVGGDTSYVFPTDAFGFNVIQAAAPTGVSGTVSLSSPALDIAGSLVALSTQQVDTGGLGRNPCQATAGSTLAIAGRGGMPPSARGLLAPVAVLGPVDAAARNDQARLVQPGCHKG